MLSADAAHVLVAGLGNIFLGDDAFGVEVVKRLLEMPLTAQFRGEVRVLDAGTRTLHLAYELREASYDLVILIDVVHAKGSPGTLYLLEPDGQDAGNPPRAADGHAVHVHDLMAVVRQLGGDVPRLLIVGCEPFRLGPDAGLSPPVAAAVNEAVGMVLRLVMETTAGADVQLRG